MKFVSIPVDAEGNITGHVDTDAGGPVSVWPAEGVGRITRAQLDAGLSKVEGFVKAQNVGVHPFAIFRKEDGPGGELEYHVTDMRETSPAYETAVAITADRQIAHEVHRHLTERHILKEALQAMGFSVEGYADHAAPDKP